MKNFAVAIYLDLHCQLRLARLRIERRIEDERAVVDYAVARKAPYVGRGLYVVALFGSGPSLFVWRLAGLLFKQAQNQSRKRQAIFGQVGNLYELAGGTHPPGIGVADDGAELISARLFDHEIVGVTEASPQRHRVARVVEPQLESAPVLFDHRSVFVECKSDDLQLQSLLAVASVFKRQV